jgi:AcrR family transcriptional regulator
MGINPPSLYAAFGDKKQLFAGALAAFYAAVLQGMSATARDGGSREAIERIARIAMLSWPTGR